MKEIQPNYYEKYLLYCGEEYSGAYKFLKFFEELHALDWRDLIADIGLEKIWVKYMTRGNRDSDLVVYFTKFFNKLGSNPIRLLSCAIEERVEWYCYGSSINEGDGKIIKAVLRIVALLRFGVDKNNLAKLAIGTFALLKNTPQEIRALAARALADYRDPMPVGFWTAEVNLKEFPFLAPWRIMALANISPEKALETFAEISEPKNMMPFHPSTEEAIKNLLKKNGGKEILLPEILKKLPEWAKEYLKDRILDD